MNLINFTLSAFTEPVSACDGPLGLQSGAIQDHQISSSVANSRPEDGRLQQNSSAWCFLYSEVQRSGEDVYLEVDLGRPQLVSGLQTQGPPAALYGAEYMRYISLVLEVSLDSLHWTDCCSQEAATNFYADDKNNEVGAVTTHAFSELIVARYVRIRVSTGLRWIGHDNKCFRFELLGCSEKSQAETELTASPQPAGYISVSWSQPRVNIPGQPGHALSTNYFILEVREGEGEGGDQGLVRTVNTSDTSHNIPSPVWGRDYQVVLTCWHHDLPLHCGQLSFTARPRPSPACRAHSTFCSEEKLLFVSPRLLTARLTEERRVEISWRSSTGGWRPPHTRLVLEETQWERRLLSQTRQLRDNETLSVEGLQPDKTYQLSFTPQAPDISPQTAQSIFSLRLVRSGSALLAFVSDLDLEAAVVWAGGLAVSWRPAVARAEPGLSLAADMYRLVVRLGETEPTFLMATNLSGEETQHQVGGLSLGQVYTVSLTCVWAQLEVDCGQVTATTRPPSLVEDRQVLSLLSRPHSWLDSERLCRAAGGHLVSLDEAREETLLEESLSSSPSRDVWTGGNMCADSPAPRDSMWSDGSDNHHTNFAGDSGLAGGRCCIYRTDSGWRGGLCHDLKLGVCETIVETSVISHPASLSVTSGHGLLAVRWDTSQEGWTPSRWLVSCCFTNTIGDQQDEQQDDEQDEDCISEMLLSKAVGVIFKKLATFAEYKITVTSYLDHFNQTQSSHQFGRTRKFTIEFVTIFYQPPEYQISNYSVPVRELNWTISLDGQLRLTWLRKFSQYQEDNPVDISWVADNESGSSNGTSRLVTIPSLSLGKTYTTTLMDLKDEDKLTTFTFTACKYLLKLMIDMIDGESVKIMLFFFIYKSLIGKIHGK